MKEQDVDCRWWSKGRRGWTEEGHRDCSTCKSSHRPAMLVFLESEGLKTGKKLPAILR